MSVENNEKNSLEELYSKRREKIEARMLLNTAANHAIVEIKQSPTGGREFWYNGTMLGKNIFTVAADMSSELIGELRAKVLKKAKMDPSAWQSLLDTEDQASQDFEFRYSPQGSRTILVKRDNVELEQLLKLRVGTLFHYEPLRPADPRYRKIPWFEEFVTFQVSNTNLAYRIIYSRVLQDSSSHLVLDGSRLLSICLGKDEIDSGIYLNAFEQIDQLFLIFGFTETKNILHADLVHSVFQRRKEANRDCWVFLNNNTGHLKSTFGFETKPLLDASKVVLL